MTKKSVNVLNQITALPAGHPVTLAFLKNLGASADLAGYYARSGWLTRLAQGLYARPGPLDLHASLKAIEQRIPGCHVGGRTALAWHGIQHFVRTALPLDLYGWDSARLPDWFVQPFPAAYRRKRLFAEAPAALRVVSAFGDKLPQPLVSDPERALLEMLSEVGNRQSLIEARAIMEGTYGLRDDVLLNLLAHCISVKTVRLSLLLSRELGLPFADALFGANLPTGGRGAWVSKTPEGWLVLK
ncbi:MAG: type IV toxin-antitoxin system AbiEi family antitoxin domain-containing protein [Rhodoferax sp.]|nr:type IV toxin-antitoxin system AbiEi family antitoxin domain-containing protein [Rhodoferax sp.]